MMHRRRRSYHSSYPTYRSRVARREYNGCFSSIKRFLMSLLTGMFCLLFAILFMFFLLVLLMHLPQIEVIGSHMILLMTIYGPLVLLLVLIIAGVFTVLGVIYGMVKLIAAISETLTYASLAHARARQEWAKGGQRGGIPVRALPCSQATRFRRSIKKRPTWSAF